MTEATSNDRFELKILNERARALRRALGLLPSSTELRLIFIRIIRASRGKM